ncbi:MAG: polysaccharide biosynthesis/export family protein, partial [Candidatus Thorarchaeota archaeon]
MKKTYWAETAARLIAFLLVGVFSVSAWAEEPLVGDLGPEVIGPGVVVMPFPTHMELILDRFLKDPGRFIGARVNPNEYLVGPGDVFTVSFVSDETEDIGVRISATGVAFIKSVGEVQVDGVTLADALAAISDEVRRIYTRADFKVQTAAFRFVRVDIIGEVVNPGTYYLPAFWRTSEAIELAGGLMPDALSRKIILRGDNRIAHFDKVRFMATGDEASNPM